MMKKLLFVLPVLALMLAVGPARAATESPAQIDGVTTITPAEAKAMFDRGVPFVDVRNDADFDAGRIPGAVQIDVKTVFSEASLSEVVGKDQEVVIYCNGVKCMRSSEACTKAVAWGFTKLYRLREGFPGWQSAGYPTE